MDIEKIDVDLAAKEPVFYFSSMGMEISEHSVKVGGVARGIKMKLYELASSLQIIKDDPQALLSLMDIKSMDEDDLESIALLGIRETGSSLFKEKDICEAIGKSKEEFRQIVFPVSEFVKCSEPDCPHGDQEGWPEYVEILAKNRTEYSELVTKGTLRGKRIVCKGCWEKYRVDIEKAAEDQAKAKKEREERYEADAKRRAEEWNQLLTMPYKEYLQTDHWKQTRKSAMKRAGYKCQLCNSDLMIQVHHRTYANRGHERNSDLVVLCRRCHANFHRVDAEAES